MIIRKITVITGLIFVLLFPIIADGQSITHYLVKDNIKRGTLIDNAAGVKFVIDKSRTRITAIDKNGKQIWKTNPATDNKLEKYRVD